MDNWEQEQSYKWESMSDSEFCAEQIHAFAYGEEHPADQAWLLTSFDTWVPNPYYNGPEVPHPESIGYDDYKEAV